MSHTYTNGMPGVGKVLSIDDVLTAMKKINEIPEPTEWLVVSPQGKMYRGSVQQMFSVLLSEHPSFNIPLEFGSEYVKGMQP